MAKVHDSPTNNLYAILADDVPDEETLAKRAGASGKATPAGSKTDQELTPKDRAAARAVQESERKAQRQAEKEKREKEAERLKLIELRDDTGFTQQRHQRIKESRTRDEPEQKFEQPKNKGPKGPKEGKGPKDGNKGPKEKTEGGNSGWGSPARVEKQDKGDGKGFAKPRGDGGKGFTKPRGDKPAGGDGGKAFKAPRAENDGGRPAKREFDRHSQSATGRQFVPKKGGHGKGNWDSPVSAGVAAASKGDAEDTNAAVDAWGESTPVDGADKPVEATVDSPVVPVKSKDQEEEEKKLTFEEFQAIQAEKRKALEALVGSAQTRALSEEETKSIGKFTVVENAKTKKAPAKPAATTPAATTTTTTSTTAAPSARKGEKAVALEDLNFRISGGPTRGRGRGGRGGQGGREFTNSGGANNNYNNNNTNNRQRGPRSQKLPHNFEAAFPTLG